MNTNTNHDGFFSFCMRPCDEVNQKMFIFRCSVCEEPKQPNANKPPTAVAVSLANWNVYDEYEYNIYVDINGFRYDEWNRQPCMKRASRTFSLWRSLEFVCAYAENGKKCDCTVINTYCVSLLWLDVSPYLIHESFHAICWHGGRVPPTMINEKGTSIAKKNRARSGQLQCMSHDPHIAIADRQVVAVDFCDAISMAANIFSIPFWWANLLVPMVGQLFAFILSVHISTLAHMHRFFFFFWLLHCPWIAANERSTYTPESVWRGGIWKSHTNAPKAIISWIFLFCLFRFCVAR